MTMLKTIESFSLVAPLGLRFWDEVLQMAIGDGLSVCAYPADNQGWKTRALVNKSSVYAFPHLPGLGDFERGDGLSEFWKANPPRYPFVIEVEDLERRFLPFSFRVRVPVQGVWQFECETFESPFAAQPELLSPVGLRPRGVPLFSSAGRRTSPGMAVVRADLGESHDDGETTAACALVEASIEGKLVARGLSDDKGRVLMMFPYPGPPEFAPDSPFAQRKALQDQSWAVDIAVHYARKSPTEEFPDICELLNQPAATLWDDTAHTTPLTSRVLHYGEELVVKSGTQSALLITAVGSPI